MRLTLEIDEPTADRLFEVAEDLGVRLDEAAVRMIAASAAASAVVGDWEVVDDPHEQVVIRRRAPGTGRDRKPRAAQPHVPLIERASEWEPQPTVSRLREIGDFEADVRRLHELGATDAEISAETGAVRQRVMRTRRRLNLPANDGKR